MKNKRPEIRFSQFVDDWEEYKLGEHSEIKTGGTPNTGISDFWFPKEIPWMSSGEVHKKRLTHTDNQISKKGLENSSARWVKEKSILIALAGQGKTRGTVAINEIPLTTNQSIAAIEVDSSLDSEFVFQNLESRYEELRMISSGDGSRGGLNKQLVADINLIAPSIKEQGNIGVFFKQLDSLISLHQSEHAKFVNIKKAMIQKMFPQNGECVPQIRFRGFTDNWELHKLGDKVEFYSGLTYSPDNIVESGTLVLRSSNVRNGEIVAADNVYVNPEFVNSQNVEIGDVIVVVRNGSRNLIGKHACVKKNMDNTVIGAFMTGIRSEVPSFTNALLDSDQFNVEINKNLGATINQITTGEFKKMIFSFPSQVEQEKIGVFFEKIDNIIALHTEQLNKLQQIKKSMLKKMFII